MGFKTNDSTCRIQLVALRGLDASTRAQCAALRRGAGRCWTELVAAHVAARNDGQWLTDAELRAMTKGGQYALHSQSIQALGQKLLANGATARALRQEQRAAGQPVTMAYPTTPKPIKW